MARRRSCDFSQIEQAAVYPSLLLLRICFLLDLVLQLLLKLLHEVEEKADAEEEQRGVNGCLLNLREVA